MRLKLETHEDCQKMRRDYEVFLLMGAIKELNFKFDGHKNPPHTLHDSKRDFYRYYKTGQATNLKYL